MDITIQKKSSMPVIFEEKAKWEVVTGNDRFLLTGKQAAILKKATQEGIKMVWFDTFALSIPHIISISLVSKPDNRKKPEYKEISEDQREKNIKRLEEIKELLLK